MWPPHSGKALFLITIYDLYFLYQQYFTYLQQLKWKQHLTILLDRRGVSWQWRPIYLILSLAIWPQNRLWMSLWVQFSSPTSLYHKSSLLSSFFSSHRVPCCCRCCCCMTWLGDGKLTRNNHSPIIVMLQQVTCVTRPLCLVESQTLDAA